MSGVQIHCGEVAMRLGVALSILVLVGCEPKEELPIDYDAYVPDVRSLEVSPSPVDFGSVTLGFDASERVVITNGGAGPIQIEDAILRPAGEGVSIPLDVHDDIIAGIALGPGDSYRFNLNFRADSRTEYDGDLELWIGGNTIKKVEVYASASVR
jgi:hypothetical protein